MIAGPWLPVPPPGYGGAEVVVSLLCEGLVKRGHEVTLFAAGDSKTSARLVPLINRHIGQDWPGYGRVISDALSEFAYVRSFLEKVDLIHDHTLHHHSGLPVRTVHTLHGPPQFAAEIAQKMSALAQPNFFVAISESQRRLYGEERVNFAGTVHNGIDISQLPFSAKKQDYLFFIGRASWEKGLDLAIRVSIRTGRRLIMAVKMTERHEHEYFRTKIEPLLEKANVTLLGDISPQEKFDYYKNAMATLFTSQWEEPFGLVMIESMACGTPVLALRRGAAPEVIADGVTGFICDGEDDMAEAIGKVQTLDPKACRDHVAREFSGEKMTEGYERIYERIVTGVKKAVLVKDIMTKKVIVSTPSASRDDVVLLLAKNKIGGLPIVEDGQLVGMVTEEDILAKTAKSVADLMSRNVITVTEDEPVQHVATVLLRNQITRAPVVRDGQLIGIVSRQDLIRALASQ